MEGYLPSLIVLAIAGVVALMLFGVIDVRNYSFVIRITEGRAVVSRGKATPEFVDVVAEICSEYGVKSGWVGGLRRGREETRLVFSRSITRPCQQRLRNAWGMMR